MAAFAPAPPGDLGVRKWDWVRLVSPGLAAGSGGVSRENRPVSGGRGRVSQGGCPGFGNDDCSVEV